MTKKPNGVERVIEAAGMLQTLANRWSVSRSAIYEWKGQGWLPLDKAKDASEAYGIPLRDLVEPAIREAMDTAAQQA